MWSFIQFEPGQIGGQSQTKINESTGGIQRAIFPNAEVFSHSEDQCERPY